MSQNELSTEEGYVSSKLEMGLIVGAARSGTTLTRLLLDAHPEVGCPAEAGLPAVMAHMARVWAIAEADSDQLPPAVPTPAPDLGRGSVPPEAEASTQPAMLTPEARGWIRSSIRPLTHRYCDARGKRLYIDKSLDSVYYLPLAKDLVDDLKVVLVFRHVMDTIASGLEASPWGFNAFGYAPYVSASPDNTVAALASYWADHVGRALAWEKDNPEHCYRLRYEDLVLAPEDAIRGVQRHLGVAEDLSVLAAAFNRPPATGPGDYKVGFTNSVHKQSIGHGKRIPVTLIHPEVVKTINSHLCELGYPPLDRSWNTAERTVDNGGQGLWPGRLRELMGRVTLRGDLHQMEPFAVVAEDHHALRWVVAPAELSIHQGDGDVESVLTGTAEDLVLMITGEENLGTLLRAGRVRHVVASDNGEDPGDALTQIRAIVDALR